jgi:hypothetical protein
MQIRIIDLTFLVRLRVIQLPRTPWIGSVCFGLPASKHNSAEREIGRDKYASQLF